MIVPWSWDKKISKILHFFNGWLDICHQYRILILNLKRWSWKCVNKIEDKTSSMNERLWRPTLSHRVVEFSFFIRIWSLQLWSSDNNTESGSCFCPRIFKTLLREALIALFIEPASFYGILAIVHNPKLDCVMRPPETRSISCCYFAYVIFEFGPQVAYRWRGIIAPMNTMKAENKLGRIFLKVSYTDRVFVNNSTLLFQHIVRIFPHSLIMHVQIRNSKW
jgi:hypothetical protein